jgi:phage tail P2-like protein
VAQKLLNPILLKDPKYRAVEELLRKLFEELLEKTNAEVIYPRIDQIDNEELLDLLGWQFHIEGWDLAKTVEEKRKLIKSAIELHRYKGTPYAIKKVLEALGLQGEVKEWYQYGGESYHFKIDLGVQNREITPELRDKLLRLINEYKNERSWLEELILSYLATGVLGFALGQAPPETETSADFQSDLEWFATGETKFAIGYAPPEVEATAVMEAYNG